MCLYVDALPARRIPVEDEQAVLEPRRGPVGQPLRCVRRIVGEELGAHAARVIETTKPADKLTAPIRAGYVVDEATECRGGVLHAAVACDRPLPRFVHDDHFCNHGVREAVDECHGRASGPAVEASNATALRGDVDLVEIAPVRPRVAPQALTAIGSLHDDEKGVADPPDAASHRFALGRLDDEVADIAVGVAYLERVIDYHGEAAVLDKYWWTCDLCAGRDDQRRLRRPL